jgi:hypothetical protein
MIGKRYRFSIAPLASPGIWKCINRGPVRWLGFHDSALSGFPLQFELASEPSVRIEVLSRMWATYMQEVVD